MIRIDKVSKSYDRVKSLDGIDTVIESGSIFGLIGSNGSGKSTLAKLLVSFWEADRGRILLGGVDVRKLPLSQVMQSVAYVSQDNFLFNCSLKENIRLGNPNATDEEVYAAAKAACCDDFIVRLEKGYDTVLSERGGGLSIGQ